MLSVLSGRAKSIKLVRNPWDQGDRRVCAATHCLALIAAQAALGKLSDITDVSVLVDVLVCARTRRMA